MSTWIPAFRKANRALGLLMRSFQTGKDGRSLTQQRVKPVMSTYFANVRSVLEFCSVVWGGAADVHMRRIERVQHKFLMWLCVRCRVVGPSLQYEELAEFFWSEHACSPKGTDGYNVH